MEQITAHQWTPSIEEFPEGETVRCSLKELAALTIFSESGFSQQAIFNGSVFAVGNRGNDFEVTRYQWRVPEAGKPEIWDALRLSTLKIMSDGTSEQPGCHNSCFEFRQINEQSFRVTRHEFSFPFPNLPADQQIAIPVSIMRYLKIRPDGSSDHPKLAGSSFTLIDRSFKPSADFLVTLHKDISLDSSQI